MNKDEVRELLGRIKRGDPTEAIEAAKKLIGARSRVSIRPLVTIASDQNQPNRIPAIYALGFLTGPRSEEALIAILKDVDDNHLAREHAAEGLGNLRSRKAVRVLGRLALSDARPALKKWCIYSLAEIADARALRTLQELLEQNPSGIVGKELNHAIRGLHRRGRHIVSSRRSK